MTVNSAAVPSVTGEVPAAILTKGVFSELRVTVMVYVFLSL